MVLIFFLIFQAITFQPEFFTKIKITSAIFVTQLALNQKGEIMSDTTYDTKHVITMSRKDYDEKQKILTENNPDRSIITLRTIQENCQKL